MIFRLSLTFATLISISMALFIILTLAYSRYTNPPDILIYSPRNSASYLPPLDTSGITLFDISHNLTYQPRGTALEYGCPVWSPDGKRFASYPTGTANPWYITVLDASGRTIQNNIGPMNYFQVDWSPTGDQIAYSYQFNIFSVSLKTGKTQHIFGPTHGSTSIEWSPDGRMLAYQDEDTLQVKEVISDELVFSSDLSYSSQNFPLWHPDNVHIFVAGRHENKGALLMINIITGEKRPLTSVKKQGDFSIIKPSQDYTQFAFLSRTPGNKHTLYRLSAEDLTPYFIRTVKTGQLAWSPDNSYVYIEYHYDPDAQQISFNAVRAEDGSVEEVGSIPRNEGPNDTTFMRAAWSPSGDHLLVSWSSSGNLSNMRNYVIKVDSNILYNIGGGCFNGSFTPPMWRP